jgi:hypothetical protein
MARSVGTLSKFVIGLFAVLQGMTTLSRAEQARPEASSSAETLTMSAFICRVRQDAALRERFSQNPRAVLRDYGIDPSPYNLPDRLTQAQLDRLLSDWSRGAGPSGSPPPSPDAARPSPPVVVYGPPPGRRPP